MTILVSCNLGRLPAKAPGSPSWIFQQRLHENMLLRLRRCSSVQISLVPYAVSFVFRTGTSLSVALDEDLRKESRLGTARLTHFRYKQLRAVGMEVYGKVQCGVKVESRMVSRPIWRLLLAGERRICMHVNSAAAEREVERMSSTDNNSKFRKMVSTSSGHWSDMLASHQR